MESRLKKYLIGIVLLTTVILTGCLIPEKFTAKIDVQADASYAAKFSGAVVNPLAAVELAQKGKLAEKDELALKNDVASMSKNPDVKAVKYLGNGRYDLVLESRKAAGQPLKMLDIFNVRTTKDGIIEISSSPIDDKSKKQFAQLGIKIDGTLDVTLPKNAEVISHNATSEPTFFGLFGTYSWKIGRVDQQPSIKFRLKK
ncbi:MAG: hypothetical protein K2X81_23895 [Candidatus Obscuribacterales bacterium]|nr:hypothetical protein [Candidatus Obscuribacterales bacterium]